VLIPRSPGNTSPNTRRMKAVCMMEKGKPAKLIDVEMPTPGDTDVLCEIAALSLNPVDWKVLDYNFLGVAMPFVMGFDFSGTVVATGSKVTEYKVGEHVFGINHPGKWGSFTQFIAVDQDRVARKPVELSHEECAAAGVAFGSVWEGMEAAKIQKDEWVYVPGGAGGVAHLAIQVAKAYGAKVISSGSRPESIAFLKTVLKCDHVFNYKESKAVDEVAKVTSKKGADVVYDSTYNTYAESARCVAKGGRVVFLSTTPVEETVANECKTREAKVFYCDLIKYISPLMATKVKSGIRGAMEKFAELAKQGYIRVHITEAFRLEEGPKEIEALKKGRSTVGKAVCRVKW